jgi:carbonic anhydrase/acetyltransferase-like protein (isoleucine patch superfamily)
MENSMVAQLTCLQMCVVGRNTFIGAGNIFTDFDLINRPIQTLHKGKLEEVGLPVLGSAVGHNCKIGSGFVVYPARMIGSNTTLIYADTESVVGRNVHQATGVDETATDEYGEPVRTVYKWPERFDPDAPKGEAAPSNADSAFIESLQVSLPKSARVRQ